MGWCSGLGDHVAGPMVQQRHGGEVHPGRVRPLDGMRGMSQRSFWGGDNADSPAALGFGPAWLGTRWAVDVAERTVEAGIRILFAPPRVYLADRPGEPEPHG